MQKRNDCPKCAAFDTETKTRMRELFGREELLVMASSLVAFLITQINTEKAMKRGDLRRFTIRKDIDMCGRTMGKFMVSLEPKDREAFIFNVKKHSGVQIDINDENCPHGEKENEVQQFNGERESEKSEGASEGTAGASQ